MRKLYFLLIFLLLLQPSQITPAGLDGTTFPAYSALGTGTLGGSFSQEVLLDGTTLFVADGFDGMRAINVTDPTNPVELYVTSTGGFATSVDRSVDNSTIFVFDRLEGTFAIDTATGDIISSYPGTGDGMAAGGDYLAIYSTFEVILLNYNAGFTYQSTISQTGKTYYDAFIDGNLLYLANYGDGISVFDIGNPTNPTQLSSMGTGGTVKHVVKSGNTLYVAENNDVKMIDVSNPTGFTINGSIGVTDIVMDMTIVGTTLLITIINGLEVYDITNTFSPVRTLKYIIKQGAPQSATTDGLMVYTGLSYEGISVIDTSTGKEISRFNLFSDVFVDAIRVDNFLYVLSYYDGLQVFNASTMELINNLRVYTNYPFINSAGEHSRLASYGDYLYMTHYPNGLIIISIAQRDSPVIVSTFDINAFGGDIEVRENNGTLVAYLATNKNILAINVTDPTAPTQLPSFAFNSERLAIAGDLLVAIHKFEGSISLFNISDPTQLVKLDYKAATGKYNDVVINGTYVYVADDWFGLDIFNIENGTLIYQSSVSFNSIKNLAFDGNMLYVNDFYNLMSYNVSAGILTKVTVTPLAPGIYDGGIEYITQLYSKSNLRVYRDRIFLSRGFNGIDIYSTNLTAIPTTSSSTTSSSTTSETTTSSIAPTSTTSSSTTSETTASSITPTTGSISNSSTTQLSNSTGTITTAPPSISLPVPYTITAPVVAMVLLGIANYRRKRK